MAKAFPSLDPIGTLVESYLLGVLRALSEIVQSSLRHLEIDLTWSLTIAYHAMIRAGRALMYSRGYLPTVNQAHKTIVEFTKLLLGEEYHGIVAKFNRLRRKRHNFIYDSQNHTSYQEAQQALKAAKSLIERIAILINKDKR